VLGARETPLLRSAVFRLDALDSHVPTSGCCTTWSAKLGMKLNGEERLALRLAKSVRILDDIKAYLERERPNVLPKSPEGQRAATRCRTGKR